MATNTDLQINDLASVDTDGCKILVVDDDRLGRKTIGLVLKRNKFQVFEAGSGEEALKIIGDVNPDLLLVDIIMGGIDGLETCRRLKQMPEYSEIPVIFLTAKSDTETVIQGLNAGGSDYIKKPFHPRESIARVKTHLKVRILTEKQKENIKALREVNEAKDKLLSITTHDLRNPLSAIRGLGEALDEELVGPINVDQREIIKSIISASDSMLALVNDLLDLSVLESGKIKLNIEPHDLREVASHGLTILKMTAADKRINLNLKDNNIPQTLNFDSRQMGRVVQNLVSNAIKFSPPDTTITTILEIDDKGTSVRLHVQDEGPGIPENEMHKLFQEFGRTSNRPTAGEASTGLGLSICRRIMESHGGTMTVANLPDKGCCFTATLPIQI